MPTTLIGTTTTAGGSDFFAAGDLAGTRTAALASGNVATLKINVGASSTYTSLVVGIYTTVHGAPDIPSNETPGTLLGSGTINTNASGVQSVSVTPFAVVSGTFYWVSLLPLGGQFNFVGGSGMTGYLGISGSSSMPSTWGTANFSDTGANGGIPMLGEDGATPSILSPRQLLGPTYAVQRAANY